MALVLKVNGRDLSAYLRVQHDDGLDPLNPEYSQPQFAGAPALRDGLAWQQDANNNREWTLPLFIKDTSVDALDAQLAAINNDLLNGAQVEFRPEGATNSTFFVLEAGQLQPQYEHFIVRAARVRATLKLWTRPFGHPAAVARNVASMTTSGVAAAAVSFPVTGILGDQLALSNLEVRVGSQVASSGRLIAYGVHPHPSFNPIKLAAGFTDIQSGATVRGASGALGSQYLALPVSPTGASGYALRDYLTPADAHTGRHRVLAVMRSGLYPAGALTVAPQDRYGQPLGPTVSASQIDQSKWSVVDLGTINVEARASGQEAVPTQFVSLISGGASGASVIASPALQIAGLVYVPLDTAPGLLRTPGYGDSLFISDTGVAAATSADLNGLTPVKGQLWSRVFGFLAKDPGILAEISNASQVFATNASALYAIASGQWLGDTRQQITFRLSASGGASGAVIDFWRGIAASGAATKSIRARVTLGPSANAALALLSHDGAATTLHASLALPTLSTLAVNNCKLVLETLGGEGRVWLGPSGAVGSPLLNPSHANLGLAGHPMIGGVAAAFAWDIFDIAAWRVASAPDADAREWFTFTSDPQPRAIQSNASVFKNDMARYFRGLHPKLPAVGSPGATAPARMIVFTAQIDDALGNDPFDVRVDARERFTHLR